MTRIDKKFKYLRKEKKKAFIAYVTAGDPDIATTKKIVLALEKAGVDLVELGIPFSDPLADGPTIQAASQRALKKKAGLKKIFKMTGALRKTTGMPILFMTYYNPVLKYGLEKFASDCRRCGVDGVIIPDLPHDEAADLITSARRNNIATVFLVAPTSTRARVKDIVRASTGFIYYVSLTGVTGARAKLPKEVALKVRAIKSVTKKPVCVGFGVSTPAQAKEAAKAADGVIVGSALVKIIGENQNTREKLLSRLYKFARSLAGAIHNE